MSKIALVMKDEITRIARKEVKLLHDPLKKQVAAQRKLIIELKRQLGERTKQLQAVVNEITRGAPSKASPQVNRSPASDKFSAKAFAATRKRLKFTQDEMAKALGVSPQTIYNWEHGTTPKGSYRERIAELQAESQSVTSQRPAKSSKSRATAAAKGQKPSTAKSQAKSSRGKATPSRSPQSKNSTRRHGTKPIPAS